MVTIEDRSQIGRFYPRGKRRAVGGVLLVVGELLFEPADNMTVAACMWFVFSIDLCSLLFLLMLILD